MKKSTTLQLLTAVFIFIVSMNSMQIVAQVPTPPGADVQNLINVVVGGLAGRQIIIELSGQTVRTFPFNTDITFTNKPLGLEEKTGAGNEDKFIVYWADGTFRIYQVVVTGFATLDFQLDSAGKVDSITISSGGISKLKGDDLYTIFGGLLAVKRPNAAHWAWDTTGLGTSGFVNDFDLDTAQNVYTVTYNGLNYQTATSSTWSKVASYPGSGGSTVFVDRRNRIFVASGSTIYSSTNNGSSWATSTSGLTANAGTFGDDAFGNIYTTNGSQAFRSADGGLTWTRIDTPITDYALDPSFFNIINGINGDTLIYASTAWGLFYSADQGTTWTIANQGIQSNPNGFWRFNNGREVANTSLGSFYKNATDSVWTQTFPAGGMYMNMGRIQGDTLGNIYTVLTRNDGSHTVILKSTDQGASWQPDTAGLAQVPQPNYSVYYADEYGGSHISGYAGSTNLIYSRNAGGSYAIDTAGIGSSLPGFGNILTFSSDHNGYLYMSGHNHTGPGIWRRPVTGGTWLPDTAGMGNTFVNQSVYDSHYGIVAQNWSTATGIYHRGPSTWVNVPFPTTVYSFSSVSALGGTPDGGILAAFYIPNYTTNVNTAYGIYCTHNLGTTWAYVPNLDSVYVNSMETFGDTTYILTVRGIYKMTCNGVVINPSGIAMVSQAEEVKLYPNPANGICHIELNAVKENATLIISDLEGREIKTVAINSSETVFPTDDMHPGIYICRLVSGETQSSIKKLVIE